LSHSLRRYTTAWAVMLRLSDHNTTNARVAGLDLVW
jgi:hypothetical protein